MRLKWTDWLKFDRCSDCITVCIEASHDIKNLILCQFKRSSKKNSKTPNHLKSGLIHGNWRVEGGLKPRNCEWWTGEPKQRFVGGETGAGVENVQNISKSEEDKSKLFEYTQSLDVAMIMTLGEERGNMLLHPETHSWGKWDDHLKNSEDGTLEQKLTELQYGDNRANILSTPGVIEATGREMKLPEEIQQAQ